MASSRGRTWMIVAALVVATSTTWAKKKSKGEELYDEAYAAYIAKNAAEAATLAAKAIKTPGAPKDKAKMLYGDALFMQGDYQRAKNVFIDLVSVVPDDMKPEARRKVAACNRLLGLPERDGLTPR